jgi:O-6-methylguanine DNA methyltransferase
VVRVWVTESGVRRIDFRSDPEMPRPDEQLSSGDPPAHLGTAIAELRQYLAGERREFDLPLDFSAATPFQRKVYDRLLQIPYGHVATYGEVARDIGAEMGTARAVGQAVGANPIAIVVPCHRVVASDGRLVGFGGGIGRKAALLRREGIDVDGSRPSSRVHPEIIRLPL